MLERVYRRVALCPQLYRVLVATEDEEIVRFCGARDIPVELTGRHPSGTDRVVELSERLTADLFVNVQGDQPLLDPRQMDALLGVFDRRPEASVATLVAPLAEELAASPSKCQGGPGRQWAGALLLPGPGSRTARAPAGAGSTGPLRLHGRPALASFKRHGPSPLERSRVWNSSASWRLESPSTLVSPTSSPPASTRSRTPCSWKSCCGERTRLEDRRHEDERRHPGRRPRAGSRSHPGNGGRSLGADPAGGGDGRFVEERWRRANRDEHAFPEIALEAMALHAPSEVDPGEVTAWALEADALTVQADLHSRFGEPSLTIYSGEGFRVDLLFWLDGTTTIHRHRFSGAFRVLLGSSLHSEFNFTMQRRVNSRLQLGALRMTRAELLEPGGHPPHPGRGPV